MPVRRPDRRRELRERLVPLKNAGGITELPIDDDHSTGGFSKRGATSATGPALQVNLIFMLCRCVLTSDGRRNGARFRDGKP